MQKIMLVLLAAVLVSCATSAATQTDVAGLNGTHWVLVEIDGHRALAETKITLDIENGLRKGNSGCNWYDEKPATPPPFATEPQVVFTLTVMDCPSKAVMQQEQRYADILFSTKLADFVWEGPELKLFDSLGKVILIFKQVE